MLLALHMCVSTPQKIRRAHIQGIVIYAAETPCGRGRKSFASQVSVRGGQYPRDCERGTEEVYGTQISYTPLYGAPQKIRIHVGHSIADKERVSAAARGLKTERKGLTERETEDR